MDNLIFSLNATVPVFLMMLLGLFLNRIGWMDDLFADRLNKFVFRLPLPMLLVSQLSKVDLTEMWDGRFVLMCFVVTVVSIGISTVLSLFLKDHADRGEFIQSSYRSSAALLGVAFIQNIYGTAGMASLMIIGSVPLYNVMAVVVLTLSDPDSEGLDAKTMKKVLKGIATNPIIIGIVIGFIWAALQIPTIKIVDKSMSYVAGLATPLGLMAMGAQFDLKKAFGKVGPALAAAFLKLVGFAAIFLPIAVALGFRTEKLVAFLVMLGSATTVSSYVMARNMNHDGVLSASVVMLTTMFSAFTLTFWLFLLRSMGLI